MDTHTLELNGRKILYWQNRKPEKNRRSLLFLHGYAGSHEGLLDIATPFVEYNVIVIDVPGFAQSEPLHVAHNLTNYALFVRELIEKLELSKVSLVGHSLGASIALKFLEKFPGEIERASVICPILSCENWLAQAAKMYYKAAELFPKDVAKFMMDNKFLVYVTDSIVMTIKDGKKKKEILEQNYVNYKQASAEALSQAFYTFYEPGIIEDVNAIRAPLQIIGAEADIISPVGPLKKLHESIPGSELVIETEGGHLLPREFPEKIVPHLLTFFSEKNK